MAFVRVQGKQIKIMHTRRVEGKVRQERLHIFSSPLDAVAAIGAEKRWKLLCDSIEANFGITLTKVNRKGLKDKIQDVLKSFPTDSRADELFTKVQDLQQMLSAFSDPLTPQQANQLQNAKEALLLLMDTMDEKLELIASSEEDDMFDMEEFESPVEAIFERGLDCYREGMWEDAMALYQRGLAMDPAHVDLHVHAGLINLHEEHYDLALAHFNQAIDYGKPLADTVKATLDKDDSLYHQLEVRPFFRALSNKAITLMRMKRWEHAIEVIQMQRSYQVLDGTGNMIGECYAAQGKFEEADSWFNEMMWADAYYTKAFLQFQVGNLEESISSLLRGVTQNWKIAEMIAGRRKPEKHRYAHEPHGKMGASASEYFHDSRHLFHKQNRFQALVKTILDDEQIVQTLEELDASRQKAKQDKTYLIPKKHFSLLHNGSTPQFAGKHGARIFAQYHDQQNPHWIPEENEIICAVVEEKMQQNWRMQLAGNTEKQFYFRPSGHGSDNITKGKQILICVSNGWFHQKRLHISGTVEK